MTVTMTPDILALCAAIDAGDDTALLALADALEEAGDPRAAGLRSVGDRWPADIRYGGPAWAFWGGSPSPSRDNAWHDSHLPAWQIGRMLRAVGHAGEAMHTGVGVRYPTLSAAFLALAEALTDDIPRTLYEQRLKEKQFKTVILVKMIASK